MLQSCESAFCSSGLGTHEAALAIEGQAPSRRLRYLVLPTTPCTRLRLRAVEPAVLVFVTVIAWPVATDETLVLLAHHALARVRPVTVFWPRLGLLDLVVVAGPTESPVHEELCVPAVVASSGLAANVAPSSSAPGKRKMSGCERSEMSASSAPRAAVTAQLEQPRPSRRQERQAGRRQSRQRVAHSRWGQRQEGEETSWPATLSAASVHFACGVGSRHGVAEARPSCRSGRKLCRSVVNPADTTKAGLASDCCPSRRTL